MLFMLLVLSLSVCVWDLSFHLPNLRPKFLKVWGVWTRQQSTYVSSKDTLPPLGVRIVFVLVMSFLCVQNKNVVLFVWPAVLSSRRTPSVTIPAYPVSLIDEKTTSQVNKLVITLLVWSRRYPKQRKSFYHHATCTKDDMHWRNWEATSPKWSSVHQHLCPSTPAGHYCMQRSWQPWARSGACRYQCERSRQSEPDSRHDQLHEVQPSRHRSLRWFASSANRCSRFRQGQCLVCHCCQYPCPKYKM